MQVNIFKDYEEMSKKTADFICERVHKKKNSLLCFPAGDSPAGTFKCLGEYSQEGLVSFTNCQFVGLDEWIGIDKNDPGSCFRFMETNLFEPLAINSANIVYFDTNSKDLEQECKRIDNYIFTNGPIDLILVGLGMNGHIGLNEPGVSFDRYSHITDLNSVTKTVAQKYFKEAKILEKGITLGMRHVMEAKTVVLIADGKKKSGILKKVVEGEITNHIPASILQTHQDCHLFLDEEAGMEINI